MELLIVFVIGVICGAVIVFIIYQKERTSSSQLTQEIYAQVLKDKNKEVEQILSQVKDAFGNLSIEALSKNSDEFLKVANLTLTQRMEVGNKDLDTKKQLIESSVEGLKAELEDMRNVVMRLEKDRRQAFGHLAQEMKASVAETSKLQETTYQLKSLLDNSKARGQWGERMAEDILKMIGLIEGINYHKQRVAENTTKRPDFTFELPQSLKVNMDVKFPLNNYLKYIQEDHKDQQQKYKTLFLRDVRNRIKEVTTKEYINPMDNTVDYVLVFIPNEQVYAFIHQEDSSLLDDALKNKVILCSPFTLYAILAVMHQAISNFNLEQTTSQILSHMNEFKTQWEKFITGMDKLGRKLSDAQKEYEQLLSTRQNQLEKPLRKIELLKQDHVSSSDHKQQEQII